MELMIHVKNSNSLHENILTWCRDCEINCIQVNDHVTELTNTFSKDITLTCTTRRSKSSAMSKVNTQHYDYNFTVHAIMCKSIIQNTLTD